MAWGRVGSGGPFNSETPHPQMPFGKECIWYPGGSEETTSRRPGGERAQAQTGIEALILCGLSISWCFTGIEIIQPRNSPEERSSVVTYARGES